MEFDGKWAEKKNSNEPAVVNTNNNGKPKKHRKSSLASKDTAAAVATQGAGSPQPLGLGFESGLSGNAVFGGPKKTQLNPINSNSSPTAVSSKSSGKTAATTGKKKQRTGTVSSVPRGGGAGGAGAAAGAAQQPPVTPPKPKTPELGPLRGRDGERLLNHANVSNGSQPHCRSTSPTGRSTEEIPPRASFLPPPNSRGNRERHEDVLVTSTSGLGGRSSAELGAGGEGSNSYEQISVQYTHLIRQEKEKKQFPHETADHRHPGARAATDDTLDSASPQRFMKTSTPPPATLASLDDDAVLIDALGRNGAPGASGSNNLKARRGSLPALANPSAQLGEALSVVDVGAESDYVLGADNDDLAPGVKRKGRIRVCVRKRPLRDFEVGEDCVEVNAPSVHVAALKQRVDLSEYTESHHYAFDDAFGETLHNESVYESCGKVLIDTVFEGGSASCFAYGQTGSGKTHTMMGNENEVGLYLLAAKDIFARQQAEHRVFVSLYEIYCNSLFDLLNHRAVVVAREDANKKVNICGLTWHEITSTEDLLRIIDRGTIQRRTGSTSANEFSSRSHAVLTITLRSEDSPKFCGSLNVVDLAGSERAADTQANDKQTRLEGAEINKSLLALKECIRGLDERKKHIPFRGSKLTEVLRDSFVGNSRTVMVATISPGSENAEHTLNTLRYAFRVKGLSIDHLEPSKERNAPRPQPTARTRSVEPVTKEKKKKKDVKKIRKAVEGLRRQRTPSRSPRNSVPSISEAEIIGAMQRKFDGLFDQVKADMASKDERMLELAEKNRKLEMKLERMSKMMMIDLQDED